MFVLWVCLVGENEVSDGMDALRFVAIDGEEAANTRLRGRC